MRSSAENRCLTRAASQSDVLWHRWDPQEWRPVQERLELRLDQPGEQRRCSRARHSPEELPESELTTEESQTLGQGMERVTMSMMSQQQTSLMTG